MKKLLLTLATYSILFTTNAQIITTVAGTGVGGFSGDGGVATLGELNGPQGISLDGSGNIYITDYANYRIRKVSTSGIVNTVAGDGTFSYSGDGGLATSAGIVGPVGVAVDPSGNIIFSDGYGNHLRRINTSGIISTIAGTGASGYSGDGGAATSAQLYYPYGVAIDASGNIFFVDMYNNRIRKLNTSGIITTIAGNGYGAGGGGGYSGDGGAATSAKLYGPTGVAVDGSGNIYIADYGNNRIRKVNTSGVISTVAGNGMGSYGGDGGPATAAQLFNPFGVATDGSGNIYIADQKNHRIRKVNTTGYISTIAGDGTASYGGDGGAATSAQLSTPNGVFVDASGNVYIADQNNNRIRKVSGTVLPIFGSTSVCVGSTITLSDGTPGGIWTSSNTLVATVGSVSGIVSGILPGITTISYGGIVTTSITVNPLPVAGAIVGLSNVCVGASITLTNTSSGGTWSATNTHASISGGIVVGNSPGIDTIKYTVSNMCGTAVATQTVTINSLPAAGAIVGPTQVCVGLSIALTNAATGGTWSNANTHTTISGGIVIGNSPGIDTVHYTVTNTCGTAVATQTLTVNPSPAVGTIIGPTNVCIGSFIVLTNTVIGGTWSSTTTSATISSGIVTGNSTGIDTIRYTVANTFCTAVTTKTVTVNSLPMAYSVTGGGSYCANGTGVAIGLSSSNAGVNYQLYNGSSTIGTAVAGTGSAITFGLQTVAGTYSVSANNLATTCANDMIDSAAILINPLPTIYTVSGSGSYSDSAVIILSVSQPGINYQLYETTSVGSPKPGTGASLSFTVITSGTYFVVATNPAMGCSDTMNGSAIVLITPTALHMLMSTENVTISPNPAHHTLSIKAPIISRVQIYDFVGRCIVDEHYNTDKTVVDIGDLMPGLYLVRVNERLIQKIIKQ